MCPPPGLNRVKLLSQQVPTFIFCCDRGSATQHSCVHLNKLPNTMLGRKSCMRTAEEMLTIKKFIVYVLVLKL